MQAEQRSFKMHPQMLYQVIVAQAGTPAKALLESVMNSIDAGATQVDITIGETGYTVSDNGKGFSGEQEVLEFFETFGTPHEEGDARWGKFRMGRGQGFAFATNRWRTGVFEMFVDIKNKGLAYDFSKGLKTFPGCRIEAEWYDQPSRYHLDHWIDTLAEFCAWCSVPVFVNGKCISKDPEQETGWTLETDDAWIKSNADSVLRVYNKGVLVRDYHRSYLGVGGTVISKQGLAMNMARNDILISQCTVWPTIVKALKGLASQDLLSGRRMDNDGRKYLMGLMIAHEKPLKETRTWRIFSDIQGRHLSLLQLANNTLPITVMAKGDRAGDTLATRKLALVLTEDTVDRFGQGGIEGLLGWLAAYAQEESTSMAQKIRAQTILDQTKARALLGTQDYLSLVDKDLSKSELAAFRAIAMPRLQGNIARIVGSFTDFRSVRLIRAGQSDIAQAWTDGRSFIWLERKLLQQAGKGLGGAMKVVTTLIHEYLHDDADAGSHSHDFGFYEAFERVLTESSIGDLAGILLKSYTQEANNLGAPVSQAVLRLMDEEAPIGLSS